MQNELWTRWIMQTAIRWEDISSVINKTGVNLVDRDHRMMIECALELNKLIDEMEESSVSLDLIDRQKQLLTNLYTITKNHFTREEAIIERFGIEGITIQKREHAIILKMLKECLNKFDAGQITVNLELKQSILTWVVHHIDEIDYNIFALPNWRNVLESAEKWDDVSHIINLTGIEYFDEQHKELVEATLSLNKYISNFSMNKDNQVLDIEGRDIFEKVINCVTIHFSDEEEFIRKFNLYDLELQEDKHESFLTLIEDFRDDLSSGRKEGITEIKAAILEWWINHINEIDINSYSIEKCGVHIIHNAKSIEDITGLVRKTGIESVDNEHISMIKTAMELSRDIENETALFSHNNSITILEKLLGIAKKHFSHEEKEMKILGLSGIEEHITLHQEILSSFEEIYRQIKSKDLVFSTGVRSKILDWWVNHTNGADYQMFKNIPKKEESIKVDADGSK